MNFVPAITACWLALIPVMGASFSDDFSSAPTRWRTHNPRAAQWSETLEKLNVTWDSRETNSFFYFPLGTTLARSDSFSCGFTLRLDDVMVGIDPLKIATFPLCLGFLNLGQAKRPEFFRGAGVRPANGPRSLVEFAYFPRDAFDPTVGPIIASTNNQIAYSHTFPVDLIMGETYRVQMSFDAASQMLITRIERNGLPVGKPPGNSIEALHYTESFGDFRVDAFSIHSYSDAGQNFPGSVLAHGVIDDVFLVWPDAPRVEGVGRWAEGKFVVTFAPLHGWVFTLERTIDFKNWENVATGTGPDLIDTTPPSTGALYRLVVTRP